MRIAKWGNSLAIRIPAEVVAEMGLKEGDEAVVSVTDGKVIEIRRDDRREEALKILRALRVKVPGDFRFSRDEIYDHR